MKSTVNNLDNSVQAWGLAVEAKRGHRSNSVLQQ